ncbi:MAG: S41 family peptidase [Clostridia bacterium]|nr:S41 family peptidase [Clostridia bacterium]
MNKTFKSFVSLLLAIVMLASSSAFVYADEATQAAETATETTETIEETVEETTEATDAAEDEQEFVQTRETVEVTVPTKWEAYVTKNTIANLCISIAKSYYYGVADEDLLYRALCSAIDLGYFDFDSAVESMMQLLQDGYSEYYSPERFESLYNDIQGEYYGIGVTITLSGENVVVMGIYPDSPAEKAGISLYDIIISIDGQSIAGMSLSDVASLIKREKGAAVKVGVMRGTEELVIECTCDEFSENPVTYEITEDNVGYIYISSFTANLDEFVTPVLEEFDAKGITNVVLDIRNNGGGELNAAISLASHFVPEGTIAKLKYKDETQNADLTVENGMTESKYNLVLLVNENSASASELFAGAVQGRGAGTIIGTTTFGKGSMQSMYRLSTGSGIKYTIAEFYTPNDERIHTIGITPDIVVENSTYHVSEDDMQILDVEKYDDKMDADNVLAVEQRLEALGYLDEADNVFDDDTRDALRAFQTLFFFYFTG